MPSELRLLTKASLRASLPVELPVETPVELPVETPHDEELAALLAERTSSEGCHETPFSGLRYYRVSRPSSFTKTLAFGPTLTVVAQGSKRATFGHEVLTFDPSRYLLITGEASFDGAVLEASPERPYLGICLSIPPDTVAKILLALADVHDSPGPERMPAHVAAVDAQIRDAVVRLVRAVDDAVERRIVAPMIIEELAFRLLRSDAAAVMRGAVPRGRDAISIEKAMTFIRANAGSALSVVDVARHVAMSPSHFAHRFRAVARVSPMRYLKQVRMEEARRMMVAAGLRASEAAARVGYGSASHFARDFKAIFGAPPAAYVSRSRSV